MKYMGKRRGGGKRKGREEKNDLVGEAEKKTDLYSSLLFPASKEWGEGRNGYPVKVLSFPPPRSPSHFNFCYEKSSKPTPNQNTKVEGKINIDGRARVGCSLSLSFAIKKRMGWEGGKGEGSHPCRISKEGRGKTLAIARSAREQDKKGTLREIYFQPEIQPYSTLICIIKKIFVLIVH